mmetsp:Transcript_17548/g.26004  ORF Transcript_17548/g.26004 Transcript_17548/m.26004 type:complete len:90 (-) Transcript_17548:843-1112(-)
MDVRTSHLIIAETSPRKGATGYVKRKTTAPTPPATNKFVIVAGIPKRTQANSVRPTIKDTSQPATSPAMMDSRQAMEATMEAMMTMLSY